MIRILIIKIINKILVAHSPDGGRSRLAIAGIFENIGGLIKIQNYPIKYDIIPKNLIS